MQAHLLNLLQTQLRDEYKHVTRDVDHWWYGYYYTDLYKSELRYNCVRPFEKQGVRISYIRGTFRFVISNQHRLNSDYYIEVRGGEIVCDP
jgi:hypothetical protein